MQKPRITGKRIVELFKKHKAKPIRGHFIARIGRKKCGCAVGIELIDRIGFQDAYDSFGSLLSRLSDESGKTRDFWRGVSDGWEGETEEELEGSSDDVIRGVRIGARAWKLCVKEGMVSA